MVSASRPDTPSVDILAEEAGSRSRAQTICQDVNRDRKSATAADAAANQAKRSPTRV